MFEKLINQINQASQQSRKPIFVDDARVRRPLTTDDLEGFNAAVDARPQQAPNLYELAAAINELKRAYPIEARQAERSLKWLCKVARRQGRNWQTPWA